MKKAIYLIVLISMVSLIYSQETSNEETVTISFESSEGYSLGNINNQNGWVSTAYGDNLFIENQVISNEQSSDGDWAFKITTEDNFDPQEEGYPIFGGYYDYSTPIDYTDSTFSFDIYIEGVPNGNDYLFAVSGDDIDDNGQPVVSIVSLINFSFQNQIITVNSNGEFQTIGNWVTNTWHSIKLEITGNNIEYFIDDVSVANFNVVTPVNITEALFTHDNWGGSAFIDNFRTNDESLSNTNFEIENNFVHFVQNSYLKLQSSTSLNKIQIFDLSGKRVINNKLNGLSEAQIDIDSLNNGVYIAKLDTTNGEHSFKFAK